MCVAIRPAGAADAAFLTEMLVEAAFWRLDGPRGGVEDVLREPNFVHYVAGRSQPDDLGMVAEHEDDPIGAAWLRYFTASDPGYGFIDPATPEVSMGVVPQWRGRGVGQRLLDALIDAARRADLASGFHRWGATRGLKCAGVPVLQGKTLVVEATWTRSRRHSAGEEYSVAPMVPAGCGT